MIYEFEILTMYDESIEVTTSNETTLIDREQDRLTAQCLWFMADTGCCDYVTEEVKLVTQRIETLRTLWLMSETRIFKTMTKEQIYEIAKGTNLSTIGYSDFKDIPKLTNYMFHKLCGELVTEGLMKECNYSGLKCYWVLNME